MTFQEAIIAYGAGSESAIEQTRVAFAASSGQRRQAVENFDNETRLRSAAWQRVVTEFAKGTSLDELHIALIELFRDHLLTAEPMPRRPILLGRAITTSRYTAILSDKIGLTELQAQGFVARMMASSATLLNSSEYWTPWRRDRTVWATFDPTDPATPPFAFSTKANEIRGLLGLDPTDRDEPLLVFEYELPVNIAALFPTVAEAYAGDGWQVFFRPAPPSANYGLTMTWHEYAAMPPRPETVHIGFSGRTFLSPAKEFF